MADNRVQIIFQARDDGVSSETKRLGGDFKNLGDAGSKSVDSIRKVFNQLLTAFAAFKLYEAAKGLVDTAANFERLETALKTITGSAAKAKDAMQWITDFAAKTPYKLDEVTQAFTKLSAQGLDPKKLLGPLGDTASSMSKNLDQAAEMFLDAVRGENERLKEFGVSAQAVGDKIVYHWSQGGRDMEIRAKNNSEAITAALLQIFSRFKGGMDEQSKTWSGQMSNLADAWTVFQNKIMASGPLQSMKSVLSNILAELDRLKGNGTLDRWANSIGQALKDLIGSFGLLDTSVETTGAKFTAFLTSTLDTGKSISATVVPALKELAGALGTLLEAYNQWPDEVKGAVGTGILTRILTGSGTLAATVAALKVGTDAMREAREGMKRDPTEEEKNRRLVRQEQPAYEATTFADRLGFWGRSKMMLDPEVARWAGEPRNRTNPLVYGESYKKSMGIYAYDPEQSRYDSSQKAPQNAMKILSEMEDQVKKLLETKTPLEEYFSKMGEITRMFERGALPLPEYQKQVAILQEQFEKGLPVEKIKEELAIAGAASNQRLQLIQAESDAVDAAHDKGIISTRQYYDSQVDITRRSVQERISFLQLEWKAQEAMMQKELQSPTKTPLEKEVLTKSYKAKMAEIDANIMAQRNGLTQSIQTLDTKRRELASQSAAEEVRAIQEITDQYTLSTNDRTALNEQYLVARKRQIDIEAQEMQKKLNDPDLVNRWAESQKRAAEIAVALKDADRSLAVAQLQNEYAGLTGNLEDQLRVSVLLIAAERDRNLLAAQAKGASEEELTLIRQIAQERIRLAQLQKSGTFLQGMEEEVKRIRKTLPTTFDLGTQAVKALERATESAADALAEYTMTGKLNFTNMINSFLKDLLRLQYQAIFKELIFGGASGGGGGGGLIGWIKGLFGGGSSDLGYNVSEWTGIGLGHQGGMAGALPDSIQVPASLFAFAPRLHDGLAPDEFPAILQSGERVLNRRETAAYNQSRDRRPLTVEVTVVNQTGTPVKAEQGPVRYDMEKSVVGVVLKNYNEGGSIWQMIRGEKGQG